MFRFHAFLGLVLTFAAFSAHAAERAVTVSGTCLKQVVPDRGSIVLASEIKGPDSKRVSDDAARLYERIKEKVTRLKLEGIELQTTEYVVEEVREWEKDRQVSRGYLARVGLKVSTTEHRRLGEVAEIATREGVKNIGRLSMMISPKKERAERNECLKEAAEQAKLKAGKLAETLGARLGDVLTIQESSSGIVMPTPRYEMMMDSRATSSKASAPAEVEAGSQDLQVTVTATFGLKN